MRTCKTIQLGPKDNRAEHDFYTTDPVAVYALIKKITELNIWLPWHIIEPSVGTGHIAKILEKFQCTVHSYDIVDRGWHDTIVADWMTVRRPTEEPVAIVMNPPYSDALAHIEHALGMLKEGEYCCALLRLQFLEGKQRKVFFSSNPMRYLFVFSYRIKCCKNGAVNAQTNNSAVAFAWFIWQKGYRGNPEIIWL